MDAFLHQTKYYHPSQVIFKSGNQLLIIKLIEELLFHISSTEKLCQTVINVCFACLREGKTSQKITSHLFTLLK